MENKILIDSVNNLKVALNEISVYDFDVYTSMELYYKIAENFNKVIRELSRFEGLISEEIVKQNEKLIYLLGDGLNQEVVNKIDNMVETGVFDTIINLNIFNNLKEDINNVSSQLEHKANQRDLETERKRIDTFTRLNEGSTTGDAELIDARIVNGNVYDNIGSAIRAISNGDAIVDEGIKPNKTNFFDKTIGKNRFNKNDENCEVGKWIDGTTGQINSIADNRLVTGYILVDEGKELKGSYKNSSGDRVSDYVFNNIAVYNLNRELLSSEGTNSVSQYYRNNKSSGAKLVRFTVKSDYQIDLQIEQIDIGYYPTEYEPYTETHKLKNKYLIEDKSGYNDLTLSSFGDSITQQGLWQHYVLNYFKFKQHLNFGKGGTRVSDTNDDSNSMCRDERINQISDDTDVLLFMGGTNDWAQSVMLGNINSTSKSEFYGALNIMTEKLVNKFPNKIIVYLTTPYGLYPNNGWSDEEGLKNKLGLTTNDYADCIVNIAKKFNIYCVDTRKTGWNKFNKEYYLQNDGAFIHPNEEGGKKLGSVIIGGLKSIEPIV